MGRILAIDYGRRRCGLAVTDPLGIVANALETVPTHTLHDYLRRYLAQEQVDTIVVGEPLDMHGNPSESARYIEPALKRLRREFPAMTFVRYDERFTSVLAHRAIIDSGINKTARRDKALVDRIAATIILNDYLTSNR